MPADQAIEVLGVEQQAAWRAKRLPPAEKLPGGLWSVPVPIPDNPLRYTLSYLVPTDDELVVVDPGWDTDEGWRALLDGLATAGASPADVTGIVATHVHPDHHGLSGRLRAESGAWIGMHPAERDTLPHRHRGEHGDPRAEITAWLRTCGAVEADVTGLFGALAAAPRPAEDMAEPDVLLHDGDLVPLRGRRLRAIWTPGHTPGHLCLQEPDARVLLTGDHVLPRITPAIGTRLDAAEPPLGQFLGSLERTATFDDHDALPAHEYRFRGLARRSEQLRAHHDQRCREILAVVAELGRPTVWEVATHLTWSRPWPEIGFMRVSAVAETAAHLEHLAGQDRIHWHKPESGTAGALRVSTNRSIL
ncbi:glyoxylase-like metal-dependent hydrolase (beta-lactamase superfamily II) [Amycolatopsis bartoniae]|uniref:MBL fold metallo-hydrolase n=1 Tax=Amycolatopsis bartoniae TaxID=941986 RepID=A0A8H9IRI5_9PSEU|nr:MBL fold metallo-hydrolase [Amycolatopsis bartoniae]MBB2940168.1 glyoxylase-like metal-dependent hydrolase (beta-lactamase superfamily II) [Amycolatopsis bartoniae]TVT06270.1 MBL fold metallo-hydrolase [Amycolatopsis bartoniae]GHF37001.1 MBL fold metallo-hydrolase [Amycolatopsis bartoniae]